ncbi:TraR/DksA family transcriptional regulator [Streptosporangium sp. NPDC000396]|uniref:TraR/DksA family transcriptional regulator n=1 Tax=Streptosporangium sp. NPDC000396 TaxID=3366185 RepID=UPI00369044DA
MTKQSFSAVLSPSEQAVMHDLLVADRESTVLQIAALTRDWDGLVESSVLMATDDEHDPEGSTIAFERAHVQALLDQAHDHLADLDQMAERLRQGTYGVCERCGQTIAFDRLRARPVARTCIACASGKR